MPLIVEVTLLQTTIYFKPLPDAAPPEAIATVLHKIIPRKRTQILATADEKVMKALDFLTKTLPALIGETVLFDTDSIEVVFNRNENKIRLEYTLRLEDKEQTKDTITTAKKICKILKENGYKLEAVKASYSKIRLYSTIQGI